MGWNVDDYPQPPFMDEPTEQEIKMQKQDLIDEMFASKASELFFDPLESMGYVKAGELVCLCEDMNNKENMVIIGKMIAEMVQDHVEMRAERVINGDWETWKC